jgi:DNA-binding transcriptional LysR family regulator
MDLRQIEVLRAFMLTGTVSGAAAFLHISQPGVSKLLKHIEDQLGVQLFRRVRGRLLPTVEAEQLFATIGEAWGACRAGRKRCAQPGFGRADDPSHRHQAEPRCGADSLGHRDLAEAQRAA